MTLLQSYIFIELSIDCIHHSTWCDYDVSGFYWKLVINQVSFWESLSWILGGTCYTKCAGDGWNCSPSIGDERGIFTFSIPFPNEWNIQVRSWPKIRAKLDQKVWKLFSPTLKMVYECVCSANGYICYEWLHPSWPNVCVCVCSGTTRFDRMDVYSANGYVCSERLCLFQPNRCICSEGLHSLQPKGFLWFLYKGKNIILKR